MWVFLLTNKIKKMEPITIIIGLLSFSLGFIISFFILKKIVFWKMRKRKRKE